MQLSLIWGCSPLFNEGLLQDPLFTFEFARSSNHPYLRLQQIWSSVWSHNSSFFIGYSSFGAGMGFSYTLKDLDRKASFESVQSKNTLGCVLGGEWHTTSLVKKFQS